MFLLRILSTNKTLHSRAKTKTREYCEFSCFITVPPKVELNEKSLAPTINSQCNLQATIGGIPFPEVKWFKDGQLLMANDAFSFETIDNTYKLILKNSLPEHSGLYKCFAENEVGKAEANATLNIHGMQ